MEEFTSSSMRSPLRCAWESRGGSSGRHPVPAVVLGAERPARLIGGVAGPPAARAFPAATTGSCELLNDGEAARLVGYGESRLEKSSLRQGAHAREKRSRRNRADRDELQAGRRSRPLKRSPRRPPRAADRPTDGWWAIRINSRTRLS